MPWTLLKLALAIIAMLVLYLVGASMVRNLAHANVEGDDEPLALADVDFRFRCVVCGAEVVMYAAPDDEVPQPPRHCAERMALIAPVE
jgi:hypothetical protein